MQNSGKINVYIDWANLEKGSQSLGFDIDYEKFFVWLRLKYLADKIYMFMGFLPEYAERYLYLQEFGYNLVFKDTVRDIHGDVKGNCDGEMILKIALDYYDDSFDSCFIVSGDGDFRCIVDFLNERNKISAVLVPCKARHSILLKRIQALSIIHLDSHYPSFSSRGGAYMKNPL